PRQPVADERPDRARGLLAHDQIDVAERKGTVGLVARAAPFVRGANRRRRRQPVLCTGHYEQRAVEYFERRAVVDHAVGALEAVGAAGTEDVERDGERGSVEGAREVLLEHVRLDRVGRPRTDRERQEAGVPQALAAL